MTANGTVTKTTRDGRTVEITAHIQYGTAWARAVIDGNEVGSGIPGLSQPVPGASEYTHRLGRVALTTAEYDAVMALIADARAAEGLLSTPRRQTHTSERLSGYQVSQLPESERTGWVFDKVIDSIGWYVRRTPSVQQER